MAHKTALTLVLSSMALSLVTSLTTCPGFPGFCSESFPGQTCNVVCDTGRNNVPLCQDDGTWTDIPRCVEHDPGVEEQIPGTCPSIPGYCAQGFLNTRCKFDCVTGADIDSICTQDGTWAPYPTCAGDLRETRDGCDGCPGPAGGERNRTAEAIRNRNTVSDRRVPKVIGNDGGRKNIPSFAGNINIGRLNTIKQAPSRITPAQRAPRQPPTRPPQQTLLNSQNFQTNFNQRTQQPQQQFSQQPQRLPQQQVAQQPQQQLTQQPPRQPQQQFVQQPLRQPQQQFAQQPQQQFAQQPQQQFAQRPQQSFNQGLNRFQPGSEASQPLSLFDQIKNKINQGNAQQAQQPRQQPRQQQPQQSIRQQQAFQQPAQAQQFSASNFGVFEEVNLGERSGGPNPPQARQVQRPQPQQDGFFGVFPEVNLQA